MDKYFSKKALDEHREIYDSLEGKAKRSYIIKRLKQKGKDYSKLTDEEKKIYISKNMNKSTSKPVKLCASNDKCVNEIMKCNQKFKIFTNNNYSNQKNLYDCKETIYDKYYPRKKRVTNNKK